jgi:hypothetical protein
MPALRRATMVWRDVDLKRRQDALRRLGTSQRYQSCGACIMSATDTITKEHA